MPQPSSLESKFTIVASGCWEWKYPLSNGYGVVRHHGKMRGAHRVVYELHRGEIPKGMYLDHLCRNSRCVNPDHLDAVSQRVNVRRGNLTKTSVADVERMRLMRASGAKLRQLVVEFGISMGHVSEILRGKYWNDAKGPIAPQDGRMWAKAQITRERVKANGSRRSDI